MCNAQQQNARSSGYQDVLRADFSRLTDGVPAGVDRSRLERDADYHAAALLGCVAVLVRCAARSAFDGEAALAAAGAVIVALEIFGRRFLSGGVSR